VKFFARRANLKRLYYGSNTDKKWFSEIRNTNVSILRTAQRFLESLHTTSKRASFSDTPFIPEEWLTVTQGKDEECRKAGTQETTSQIESTVASFYWFPGFLPS